MKSVLFTTLAVSFVVQAQPPRQFDEQSAVVCDCGFQDEANRVWSDIWYADYDSYKADLQKDTNYVVMDYTVSAKHPNTFDRVFDPNNVRISEDGGIQLRVRRAADGRYTSASFGTKRQDMLYGTYRASIKTSNEPGTVAAFFFYRNNTCEIDMESLSRIQNPWKTYLSVQPQIYNADGSASNVTNDKHVLDFDPTTAFHEYRFDWTPTDVTYFLDGQQAQQFNASVPQAPGRVILNHWTDGNPNYSGAAPSQDAVLQVANLTVFFNSSEASGAPKCQHRTAPCSVADIMSRKMVPGSTVTPQQGTDGDGNKNNDSSSSSGASVLSAVSSTIIIPFAVLLFSNYM